MHRLMIAGVSQIGLALLWGEGVGRDRGRKVWQEGGIWRKKDGGLQGRGSSVAQAAFGELITVIFLFKDKDDECAFGFWMAFKCPDGNL